ncbi:hypothetical protein ACKWRH_28075 [Bradyrhizobium sp. Pa8]|uniref:hypothetical protein n=1 Tax=Bradyrhizobium sp. Pa8 TaxID=3386552 RepID=UPI00403F51C9
MLDFFRTHGSLLVRVLVVGLAQIAIVWGCWTLPLFWNQGFDESVAREIVSGRAFRPEVLSRLKSDLDAIEQSTYCRASATRSAAIIRLRIAEQTLSMDKPGTVDQEFDALRRALFTTLSCSPADPFSWLALFWLSNNQIGFKSENLEYLRLSYELGPSEGWIALKRNHIAFSVFEALDPVLAKMTIKEFIQILNTGLYMEAVEIFTGPAWRVRDQILPLLTQVPIRNREVFANVLRNRGYEVIVPGVSDRRYP